MLNCTCVYFGSLYVTAEVKSWQCILEAVVPMTFYSAATLDMTWQPTASQNRSIPLPVSPPVVLSIVATTQNSMFVCLFVCLGLTSLWNIWGHITTVPACSSGTLTNVLPHRNAMPQTQDTTPHPVTVYRHGANLSLCYPSMWNVTLEYTATHFNVLGETRPGNPSPTFQLDAVMVVNNRKLSRKYRTNRVLNPGPVVCESNTLSARPQRLHQNSMQQLSV